MTALSIAYAALFYAATAILVVGVALKIRSYARTPAPLMIPTTPAPTTTGGVALRLTREVVFFESLFKASKWTWIFGWMFHVALLLVILRHFRYFQQPVWDVIAFVQPFGTYAGFAMVAGLAGLWARRFLVDRVRYISTPSDHLHLALLIAIGLSGLTMRFVSPTDIVAVKAFMLGLMRFDIQPLPADPLLLLHLTLVALLMIVFPISKLLHAPGLFFSPTRNQVDNPREARHLAAWAAALDKKSTEDARRGHRRLRDAQAQALPGDPAGGRGRDLAPQALRRLAGDPDRRRLPRRAHRRLGAARGGQDGRAARQVPLACASTWTPACTAAPAATSATISWAPATRRTCRWRART